MKSYLALQKELAKAKKSQGGHFDMEYTIQYIEGLAAESLEQMIENMPVIETDLQLLQNPVKPRLMWWNKHYQLITIWALLVLDLLVYTSIVVLVTKN